MMGNSFIKNLIIVLLICGVAFFSKQMPENTNTKASSEQSKFTAKKATNKKGNIGTAIPDYVYDNTMPSDKFSNVINANKKVIFFAAPDCNMGRKQKNFISNVLQENYLDGYYEYVPNLNAPGPAMVFCKNKTNKCAQIFLWNNCSDVVCIINPGERRYYKVSNYRKIGEVAESLKNW